MEFAYYYEMDDPYKVLAYSVIGYYRPADVIRMLNDDAYLLNCIVKEVRVQDLCGRFVDCIIEDILARKKRMELMRALDQLSEYLYENLDKERLRREIQGALSKMGVDLVDSR